MVRNELLGSAAVSLRDLGGNPVRHYLYSGGSWSWLGDEIFLGRQRIAQVTSSGTRYFHVDHLGSVRRVSTGAGALEKAYDFYPYGLPVKETVGQERLWFASYELEHQNTPDYTDDLYFLHARWYFPSMGRFLSPDPVRGDPAQPQSLNLYAYVRGNPINFVDPFGLKDQGAMSPASTNDEWQRDGVCRDVMSDPDCWNEQITVTAKAPRIDLQQIADVHDAKVLQEWLAWQAYTNSAYALRTAAQRPPEMRAEKSQEVTPPAKDVAEYVSLTVAVAIPNPLTLTLVGAQVGMALDRFGNVYLQVGGQVGKAPGVVGGSLMLGDYRGNPTAEKLSASMAGWFRGVAAGSIIGMGINASGATEVGLTTPQASVAVGYTFRLLRIGNSALW